MNKSKNWVTALESWTCPTAAGKSDQSCDPCGMKYLGNWRHMHCRGYSNGAPLSQVGIVGYYLEWVKGTILHFPPRLSRVWGGAITF